MKKTINCFKVSKYRLMDKNYRYSFVMKPGY
jgi:hypothetical protein